MDVPRLVERRSPLMRPARTWAATRVSRSSLRRVDSSNNMGDMSIQRPSLNLHRKPLSGADDEQDYSPSPSKRADGEGWGGVAWHASNMACKTASILRMTS